MKSFREKAILQQGEINAGVYGFVNCLKAFWNKVFILEKFSYEKDYLENTLSTEKNSGIIH
jgi:hypothetical protein